MMHRSVQDSPYQASFAYDQHRPAFPHLKPPSLQRSRIPLRKTPISARPSPAFNQSQLSRQSPATNATTTTITPGVTVFHSPEYDPRLENLSKNRKRARDDCVGDFDDENYGSMRRNNKSANNGESFNIVSRWRLDGRDGDHTMDDDSDGEDSAMRESFFSDTQYRRNAGPLNGPRNNLYESDTRGGKRRLLDVVGSVVGAVWEFCKSQAPSIQLPLAGFKAVPAEEYFSTPFNCPPDMFKNEPSGMGTQKATTMDMEHDISTPYKSLFDRPIAKTHISPNYSRPFNRHDQMRVLLSEPFISDEPTLKLKVSTDADISMSASWIMIPPGASPALYTPPSPSASTASMRRQSPQRVPSPSIRADTPTVSPLAPPNRRPHHTRPVSTRRAKLLGRPVFTANSSRTSSANRNFTSPSAPVSPSYTPPQTPEPWTPRHSRRETISALPSTAHLNLADRSSSISSRASGPILRRSKTARKRVDEDDEDESMKRFTASLNFLIKQGKEALGSKVEVIDCDDEENWDE